MSFPRLEHLMGGYFHQDYDHFSQTDEEILAEFASFLDGSELTQAISELTYFIDSPRNDVADHYASKVDDGGMIIGENDEAAHKRLVMARDVMTKARDKLI